MALYYVSGTRGNDSTGTGSATAPWKTIGKAIGTSPAITLSGSGDTLYIEPGVYREVLIFGLSPTSASPFNIVGDGDGSGFLAGGYATPITGTVDWRGWSDYKTPISGSSTFLSAGKSYINFTGLKVVGNAGATLMFNGGASNITITRCKLQSPLNQDCVYLAGTAGSSLNVTIDQCDFMSMAANSNCYAVDLRMPASSAEYNANVLVRNSMFCGAGVRLTTVGGSGSYDASGLTVQNCTFVQCSPAVSVTAVTTGFVPASWPSTVSMCRIAYCNVGLTTSASGNLIDGGGNKIHATTALTNVTAATGTDSVTEPSEDFGDWVLYGGVPTPFGVPLPFSQTLGVGSYGTPPAVDFFGRARPEGTATAAIAAGAFERHDTAVMQSSVVQSGTSAHQIGPGPGSQTYRVPVSATATTLSLYTYADSNYGTTSPPVLTMLAEPALGVSGATVTAPANTGTWNQLAIGPFTPTASGIVTLRVSGVPAATTGNLYIDSFAGSTGDLSEMGVPTRGGSVPSVLTSTSTTIVNNIFNVEC